MVRADCIKINNEEDRAKPGKGDIFFAQRHDDVLTQINGKSFHDFRNARVPS